MVKNNDIVGHFPREYSRILWYFIVRGKKIYMELTGRRRHCRKLCGGMEIPCRLVFSCSSKVKINRLKELVESKIRRINTQRHKATTHEKKSMKNSNKLAVSFMFIS